MVLHGCKRRREHIKVIDATGDCALTDELRHVKAKPSTHTSNFPLLELPYHILCDIVSRLPLVDIFRCRCVCKTTRRLLKDPYFSRMHLTRAPNLTTNLILQENMGKWGALYFFTFDQRESAVASWSSDGQYAPCYFGRGLPTLTRGTAEFSFRTQRLSLVASCNGLLCLYFDSTSEPFYGICNPLLGECLKLPPLKLSVPVNTYANHSGFGYCPKMKQYKVIHFMHLPSRDPHSSPDSKQMVANIHTLGSDTWRRIENVPYLKRNSFNPFLNGALHWVTNSSKPSELIYSFDLEGEKFKAVPPPAHFNAQYVKKLSCINIGVLRGCLCICYIYESASFEVWVMKEYGARESWVKEFGIDMKFYCRLQAEDLRRPIKFFSNGDLWFISSSDTLVSFSPEKQTFRELRAMGHLFEGTAHDLSFISLKDAVGALRSQVRKLRFGRKKVIFGV